MDAFVRRVVTGFRGEQAVLSADGEPPRSVVAPSGFAASELLWLEGPPTSSGTAVDREGEGFPLEPPPGGVSSRIIRMPGGGDWLRVADDDRAQPGMHATDTLDLMVVLEGEIVLGLPESEVTVAAGSTVIQRGTPHRWRVPGEDPCTYWVTMLRPDPSQRPVDLGRGRGDSGVRRVVTGDASVTAEEAPVGLQIGGTTLVDLWSTGGPLASPSQGGDAEGPWALEPPPGGVVLRWLELAPSDSRNEAGWHETATIDVDVILGGRVALELPGGIRTELGVGDVVVQRATDHRWVVVGDEPLRMATVMIGFTS